GARKVRKIRFAHSEGSAADPQAGLEEITEDRARRFARVGALLLERERPVAAALEYEKARTAAPGDPTVGARLARIYLELHEYARAAAVAEPLVAAIPDVDDDAGLHATLGAAYLGLGKRTDAARHLEAALRSSPFDPAVRCGLAT